MNKTFLANVIIHSFATAHAIAAAALAQTLVGDEATLTALTIAMIIALSKLYQAPLSWGGALSFLGVFAGFYLGTRGATCLIKWVPGIGNTANALSTIFTTEVLGWATVYLLSRGRDLSTVRKDEANHIIREGKALRKKNEAEKKRIDNIVNTKMTSGEKALYHSIMEQLKDENISDSERENLIRKLDELFKKYE
mgnify:FL=1